MLQTRVGKRTAAVAFRIAGAQLDQLMFPRFANTTRTPIATGVAATSTKIRMG